MAKVSTNQSKKKSTKASLKTPVKSKSKGVVTANLNQFNDLFRDLFKKKQIMGISLKKISGTDAKWKKVNVITKFRKNIKGSIPTSHNL